MKYRKIGKSDLKASVIGFGAWGISGDLGKVSKKEMFSVIREAIDLGINFFDTAPAYGVESRGIEGIGVSEKLLGEVLSGHRDKIIIGTKFGVTFRKILYNGTRKHIIREIEDSLKRLRTDYIDLYQAHWPDPYTPTEETFLTLNDLQKSGKIRYIGVCNYSVSLLEEAMIFCKIISSQNLYNLIQRNADRMGKINLIYRTESEILPFCKKKNIGFIPYAPFCQGLLTGKLKNYNFETSDWRKNNDELNGKKLFRNLEIVKKLLKISDKIGKPLSQIVLNWLLKDNGITTIIAGPKRISEVRDNVESLSWSLEDETYKEIDELTRNVSFV